MPPGPQKRRGEYRPRLHKKESERRPKLPKKKTLLPCSEGLTIAGALCTKVELEAEGLGVQGLGFRV